MIHIPHYTILHLSKQQAVVSLRNLTVLSSDMLMHASSKLQQMEFFAFHIITEKANGKTKKQNQIFVRMGISKGTTSAVTTVKGNDSPFLLGKF